MTQKIPTIDFRLVPRVTTDQMIEVDRAMIEDFGIELVQMMENAGRALADLARRRFFGGDPTGHTVFVLAGGGGNGGGAMVCARRLHNWGALVQVQLSKPREKLGPVPAHQLRIIEKMGVPVSQSAEGANLLPGRFPDAELIIDGLIGYSLTGHPRGSTRALIEWANSQAAPILSLDVPSGMDAAAGTVSRPTIQAFATLTLALPKAGMETAEAQARVGELYLADISVPPGLFAQPGLGIRVPPLFASNDVVRLLDLSSSTSP